MRKASHMSPGGSSLVPQNGHEDAREGAHRYAFWSLLGMPSHEVLGALRSFCTPDGFGGLSQAMGEENPEFVAETPPANGGEITNWLRWRINRIALLTDEGTAPLIRLIALGSDHHILCLRHQETEAAEVTARLEQHVAAACGTRLAMRSDAAVDKGLFPPQRRAPGKGKGARTTLRGGPDIDAAPDWPLTERPVAPPPFGATQEELPLTDSFVSAIGAAARGLGISPAAVWAGAVQLLIANYCAQPVGSVRVHNAAAGGARYRLYCGGDDAGDGDRTLADILRDAEASLTTPLRAAVTANPPVLLVLGARAPAPLRLHGLDVSAILPDRFASGPDLRIAPQTGPEGAALILTGREDLFPRNALVALGETLIVIVQAVIDDARLALRDLALVPDARCRDLARRSVAPPFAPPLAPQVGDLASAWNAVQCCAAQAPALVSDDKSWTRQALGAAAQGIAAWLADDLGLRPGDRIGLLMGRSADLVLASLGGVLAGLVIVPLDPDYGSDRLRDMIADAECRLILTDIPETDRAGKRAADLGCRVLALPDRAGAVGGSAVPQPAVDPDQAAYILFTSGTTGRPKGVVIRHRAIVRLVRGLRPRPPGPADRVPLLASPSFDATLIEIWGALLNGAALLLPIHPRPTLVAAADMLRNAKPSYCFLASALFNALVDEFPQAFATLKIVMTGGEPMSRGHAQRLLALHPGIQVVNVYGPTENGVLTTTETLGGRSVPDPLPVGQPLPDNMVFVLNAWGQVVPPGFAGEVHVGGGGLSSGYLNRADMTAQKFALLPADRLGVAGDMPILLFRTGDRGAWPLGGAIRCFGRMDDMVKILGHRVELAQVELLAASFAGVGAARAVALRTPQDATVTGIGIAYEALGNMPDPDALLDHVRAGFARFTPPIRMCRTDHLPVTANGKTDRGAIARMFDSATPLPDPATPDAADGGAALSIHPELVGIWEGILHRAVATVDADFFDLGGQSLSVMQMLVQVEKRFGRKIEIERFLADPRIGALADQLDRAQPLGIRDVSHHIVTLREGDGAQAPLICVFGLFGSCNWAFPMLRNMAETGRPVLGLMFGAQEDWPQVPETLMAVAQVMADAIVWRLDGQPANLIGYSLGGTLAQAIASALGARDYPVGHLIVVDPDSPLRLRPLDALIGTDSYPNNLLAGLLADHRSPPAHGVMDIIRCTQDFPRPPGETADQWALVTGMRVRRHPIATAHAHVAQHPWSRVLGAMVQRILQGGQGAGRDGVRVTATGDVVSRMVAGHEAARAGDFAAAHAAIQSVADAMTRDAGVPAFVAMSDLFCLARSGQRRAWLTEVVRLWQTGGGDSALWRQIAADAPQLGFSGLRLRALQRGYALSGPLREGGYVLALELAARRGQAAGLAIADALIATVGCAADGYAARAVILYWARQTRPMLEAIEKLMASTDLLAAHVVEIAQRLLLRSATRYGPVILAAALRRFPDDTRLIQIADEISALNAAAAAAS